MSSPYIYLYSGLAKKLFEEAYLWYPETVLQTLIAFTCRSPLSRAALHHQSCHIFLLPFPLSR